MNTDDSSTVVVLFSIFPITVIMSITCTSVQTGFLILKDRLLVVQLSTQRVLEIVNVCRCYKITDPSPN